MRSVTAIFAIFCSLPLLSLAEVEAAVGEDAEIEISDTTDGCTFYRYKDNNVGLGACCYAIPDSNTCDDQDHDEATCRSKGDFTVESLSATCILKLSEFTSNDAGAYETGTTGKNVVATGDGGLGIGEIIGIILGVLLVAVGAFFGLKKVGVIGN